MWLSATVIEGSDAPDVIPDVASMGCHPVFSMPPLSTGGVVEYSF